MLRAVIFDVDGTLLDTERIYIHAWQQSARQFGFTLTRELLLRTRGASLEFGRALLEQALGEGFCFEAVRMERIRIAEEIIRTESPVCKPGVRQTLDALHRTGVPAAVATSTNLPLTRTHLALSEILDDFSAIVTGDQVAHGKPEPDIFLLAAERLGIAPEACLVVEDSESGLQAAEAAGMQRVLIPDLGPVSETARQSCLAVLGSMQALPPLLRRLRT